MRNLKRALSLLLSSTMVLGMLVMGGSAAGYKDVDDSNVNQEAIEVLQTVGIMTGDQNGNFNPDGSITRNEMAVIMAHLLNLDYDYYRGTNPFTDVPEWAAPYVAACAAEGVIAGIGNNQFGGEMKVTAAQASLMIMKALGYFQNAEDFGTDWQVATIRQASYINLFDNISSNAESALTRAQVAQLVLNGLKAKMVDFTGDKGIQIGDVTVGYNAEYTARTNANKKYNSIDTGKTDIAGNNQYYVQLGEELYNGDLKLADDEADVFGRPAHTWSFDGEKIGTYVNYDLMVEEYTTSVSGKELYDVVGKTAFDKYDFSAYVDGKDDDFYKQISKNNKDDVDETDNGALTQVFVDSDAEEVVVTVINTYLAKANADYSEKKDSVTFGIYENNKSTTLNKTVSGEDFDIADIKKDDFVLVNYSYESEEIEVISDVEILSNVEISKFSTNGTATSVTVDGTKYDDSNKLFYDEKVLEQYANTNLKDTTFNVYLDQYGYMIGIEEVDGVDNYVFITGVDPNGSNLTTKSYDANAIFVDGTSKVIEVKNTDDVRDLDSPVVNKWFTYTKNSSDVYTLTAVTYDRAADSKDAAQSWTNASEVAEINDKHISLNSKDGKIYGNDDSVYLLAELDKVNKGNKDYAVIKGADEVVTGIDNVSIDVWNYLTAANDAGVKADANGKNVSYGTYALYDDDNYVIAAVVVGESGSNSSKIAYVNSDTLKDESYDKTTDEWTRTREVIINGESVILQEVRDDNDTDLKDMQQYAWYTIKYDAEGNVKDVELYNNKTNKNVTYFVDLNAAVKAIEKDEKDTIVVELGAAPTTGVGKELTLIGKTLYYDKTSQELGLRIAEDVNVVLVQTVKNQTTTTYETGVDALSSILKDLNEKGNAFNYEFSAVIENGRATSIVIIDNNKEGAGQGPAGGQATDVKTVVMTDDGKVSLKGKDDKAINTQGYSYELWMRGPSQDAFNVAKTGKFLTNAPDFQLTMGSSYYLIVDGVKSDVITATAP